jgi:hypothetical protein
MKAKLFYLILALLALGTVAQAQTEKNKLFVAGNFRIEVNNGGANFKYQDGEDKYSYFDFDFQPKVGYTVIDNLPIGLFMDVDRYIQKSKDDDDKYREKMFAVGPFVRYYITDIVGLKPYGEALFGIGCWGNAFKDGSADEWEIYSKESYLTFRIGGGVTYFFNDWVGADLFMGFNHESWTDKSDNTEESRSDWDYKDVYNEFIMQVGIVVMFPLKK